MLKFFKENLDNTLKLFVNQIAMTIFGLLLSAATFSHKTLLLVTGILSALFYLYLLYTTAWDIGARDKIKVDGGRMKSMPLKGLYLALCANIINIVLAIVSTVCYFLADYLLLQWAANTTAIAYNILWLTNGMYISLLSFANMIPLKYFLMAATVIPALITCALAYHAGTHNFRLFGFISGGKSKRD